MPKCEQCDAEVPEGAAFCPVCRWPTSVEIITQTPREDAASGQELRQQALATVQEGDYVRAQELLEEAVGSYPDDPEVHFQLGFVYFKNGQISMAVFEWEAAKSLDPDNPRYDKWIRRATGGDVE